MGRLIGYARISTPDQSLDLQVDELKSAGCKKIYTDKISGARAERPGLNDCLKTLRAGDTLMVWRLDRLGRSMPHLVTVVTDLRNKKIGFKSLRDGVIDTTTASGEVNLQHLCRTRPVRPRIDQRKNAGRSKGSQGQRSKRRAKAGF